MANEGTRRCPRDGGTLTKRAETFVTLDVCPTCDGSFYERGEAETALSAGADIDQLVESRLAQRLERGGGACPGCAAEMRTVRVVMHHDASAGAFDAPATFRKAASGSDGTRDGTTFDIDVCPGCNGLWLDAGEAEKLAQIGRESRSSMIAERDAREELTKEKGPRGWKLVLSVLGIKTAEERRREL